MQSSASAKTSEGVQVFGSALLRVPPDIASIVVSVSRLEDEPTHAFSKAHASAKAVHSYLLRANVDEVQSSRITLSQETRYEHGEPRFIGYQARLGYHVILRDLDRVEEILIGLIDAGANELTSVTFETSQLKEIREDARARAIEAARRKAEVYAEAAGIGVGDVVFIEDMNPDFLSGRREGHVHYEAVIDDSGDLQAIDPGAITIGAAVTVVYSLGEAG